MNEFIINVRAELDKLKDTPQAARG